MSKVYDYQTIRDLPRKSSLSNDDYVVIECRDGTKIIKATNIISTGITNNLFFENVSQMSNATDSLDEGSVAITLGYRTPGDGGGAKYIVRYAPGEVSNNYSIIDISGKPTLKAYILTESIMFPEQLGAYGDGVHDDTFILNVFLSLNTVLGFYSNKTYKANGIIIPKNNMNIDFNYCNIESSSASINIANRNNVNIRNCNINSSNAIYISNSNNINLENISINNEDNILSSYGINIENSSDVTISNTTIENTYSVGNAINLVQSNTSIIMNNITINNCRYGINMNSSSISKDIVVSNSIFKLEDETTAIYISGQQNELTIKDSICSNGECFINNLSLSSSNIVIDNITIEDTNNVYDINDNTTYIIFKGIHNYITSDITKNIFKSLLGELFIHTNNINSTLYKELSNTSIHTGKVHDMNPLDNCMIEPKSVDLLSSNGTLNIETFRNCVISITGSIDIASISAGITGQIIDLRSSDGRRLAKNTYTVEMDSAIDIDLHKYKGIRLMYLHSKWVQI